MFENWKLRDRILLGYAVPIVLFGVFSVIVNINSGNTIASFNKANKLQAIIFETNDMVLRITLMGRQVRGYLLVGNADNSLEGFNEEKRKFQEAANRAENLIKDQNTNELLQKFRRMLELASQYEELSRKTFRTFDEGKQKEAVGTNLAESKIIVGEFNKLDTEINNLVLEELKKIQTPQEILLISSV